MDLAVVIVDDEPLARRIVEKYVQDIDGLTVVAQCESAVEALSAIQENHVDIMFLDIDMPRLSGLAFLRTLQSRPLVVLTTAYQEYAVDGYDLDVVDFLVKPFSFERFLMAVRKVRERVVEVPSPTASDFLFIKVDKTMVRVNVHDIHWVEGMGDYVKIATSNDVHVTYQSMKKLAEVLPQHRFPRIHKSYMVALSKVDMIEGNMVKVGKTVLPIGKSYRTAFLALVDARSS